MNLDTVAGGAAVAPPVRYTYARRRYSSSLPGATFRFRGNGSLYAYARLSYHVSRAHGGLGFLARWTRVFLRSSLENRVSICWVCVNNGDCGQIRVPQDC